MTMKATQKIVDALAQLVEGFTELQGSIEEEFDPEREVDEDEDKKGEADSDSPMDVDEALVTEVRAAIESVIENEDCSPEDLASVISALTDALEEIDPEIFVNESDDDDEEEEEYKAEEYEDDDDDDIDLDDEDEYDDEDEEEEDDDEEEEEEDVEEDDDD